MDESDFKDMLIDFLFLFSDDVALYVFDHDLSGLIYGLFGVFLAGLLIVLRSALVKKIKREANDETLFND